MPRIENSFVKLSKLYLRILFRLIRVAALFTTSSTSSVNLFVKFARLFETQSCRNNPSTYLVVLLSRKREIFVSFNNAYR